ncbi:hypothetical protein MMPV_002774 [Pyropia vietnamensis]
MVDGTTARDLRVAQAILDGAAVVKELVENALDGGATRVDIRVRGPGGLAAISVADNGRGIPVSDQDVLCAPHATSKWTPDTEGGRGGGGGGAGGGDPEHRIATGLGAVVTYGFRGEALSAIAALSETLIVTTRTADEEVGRRLTYGPDGALIGPPVLAPRHPGTTVEAGGLFARLPVRRTDAERHAKREMGRLLLTVQAFAVIATAARVVLYLDGQSTPVISTKPRATSPTAPLVSAPGGTPSASATPPLALRSLDALRDNIVSVFGARQAATLEPLAVPSLLGPARAVSGYGAVGWVSSVAPGAARSAPDRQLYFVNGRPADVGRIARAIAEHYRKCGPTAGPSCPVVVLELVVPAGGWDVNLSPDKREVLLPREREIIDALLAALNERWAPGAAGRVGATREQGREGGEPAKGRKAGAAVDASSAVGGARGGGASPPATRQRSAASAALLSSLDSFSRAGRGRTATQVGRPAAPLRRPPSPPPRAFLPPAAPSAAAASQMASLAAAAAAAEPPPVMGRRAGVRVGASSGGGGGGGSGGDGGYGAGSPPSLSGTQPSGAVRDLSALASPRGAGAGVAKRPRHAGLDMFASGRVAPRRTAGTAAGLTAANVAAPLGGVGVPVGRRSLAGRSLPAPRAAGSTNARVLDVDDGAVDGGGGSPLSSSLVEAAGGTGVGMGGAPAVVASPPASPTPSPEPMEVEVLPPAPRSRPSSASDAPLHAVMPFDLPRVLAAVAGGGGASAASTATAAAGAEAAGVIAPNAAAGAQGSLGFTVATVDVEASGGDAAAHTAAESELVRVFQRSWFADLAVIGQFNLGFVLARRGADVFIIDQHAADEKYNYEALAASTPLQVQPLMGGGLPLELAADEELLAMEYAPALRASGFTLAVRPERPPTQRLRLTSVPFSRNVVFGVEDVAEMLATVKAGATPSDGEGGVVALRPGRLRAVLANRACRKSIMIGAALGRLQMRRVLVHLAGLTHPWTCPHGRPTMRHLWDLSAPPR